MSQKIGRNEACPCGSGKKYKKCCGGNVAAQQPPHPIHAADREFSVRLLKFAQRHLEPDQVELALLNLGYEDGEQIQADSSWYWLMLLYHDGGPEGLEPTLFERFLATQPSLSRLEKWVVEAQKSVRFSIYEVAQLRSGESVLLRDLPSGQEFWVEERSLAEHKFLGRCLLARVAPLEDGHVVLGAHPFPLWPNDARLVLQQLEFPLTLESLRVRDHLCDLNQHWQVACEESEEEAGFVPEIEPGEDFCLTRDDYTLDPQLWSELQEHPDIFWDEEGLGSWTNSQASLLGKVKREGDLLEVVCQSLKRADQLAALLAESGWVHQGRQELDALS